MSASSSQTGLGDFNNNSSVGFTGTQMLWAAGIAGLVIVLVFLFKGKGK